MWRGIGLALVAILHRQRQPISTGQYGLGGVAIPIAEWSASDLVGSNPDLCAGVHGSVSNFAGDTDSPTRGWCVASLWNLNPRSSTLQLSLSPSLRVGRHDSQLLFVSIFVSSPRSRQHSVVNITFPPIFLLMQE